MKKTLGLLVVVVFSVLTFLSANAETAGVPMMYQIRPERAANQVLADLVAKSLKRDPSGNGRLDGSPCATPNDFVRAIQKYHPGSKLGGAQELPGYLKALIFRNAPSGTFPMSRMVMGPKSNGKSSCTLDLEGWSRTFKDGEGAWYDANTGLVVLAGDCSNVVDDRPPAAPPKAAIPSPAPPTVSLTLHPNTGCPEGVRRYFVHFWRDDMLTPGLRSQAHALTAQEIDFTNAALSRTLGGPLRTAELQGEIRFAPGTYNLRISWIREGENHEILEERDVEDVTAPKGVFFKNYSRSLTDSDWIIRVVFPWNQPEGEHVVGPKISPRTGNHEIRVYPREWMNDHGGRYCNLHSHALLVRGTSSDSQLRGASFLPVPRR